MLLSNRSCEECVHTYIKCFCRDALTRKWRRLHSIDTVSSAQKRLKKKKEKTGISISRIHTTCGIGNGLVCMYVNVDAKSWIYFVVDFWIWNAKRFLCGSGTASSGITQKELLCVCVGGGGWLGGGCMCSVYVKKAYQIPETATHPFRCSLRATPRNINLVLPRVLLEEHETRLAKTKFTFFRFFDFNLVGWVEIFCFFLF